MKISLGQLVITPGAEDTFTSEEIQKALDRFAQGDWGNLVQQDKMLNDLAIEHWERLLGAYRFRSKELWIITEADRSVTTILLPEEY